MKAPEINRARGSVVALAFIAMVPLVGAIGGYAVDVMHVNAERLALQRATDAAAIAGANDIVNYSGALATSATTYSAGNEDMVNYALVVARENACDGHGVVTAGSDIVTATAVVISGSSPSYTTVTASGAANPPTGCLVQATVNVRSLMLTIFGNFFGSSPKAFSTPVTTSSLAGFFQNANGYPQTVSSTDVDSNNGKSLSQLSVGSVFWWSLHDNAMWSGVGGASASNAAAVAGNITAYGTPSSLSTFNVSTQPGMGPITIGTTLQTTNGVQAGNGHTLDSTAPGTLLWMPVINSVAGTHVVIGFVLVSYIGSNGQPGVNDGWQGTIVRPPGVSTNPNGMAELPVKLLQ